MRCGLWATGEENREFTLEKNSNGVIILDVLMCTVPLFYNAYCVEEFLIAIAMSLQFSNNGRHSLS